MISSTSSSVNLQFIKLFFFLFRNMFHPYYIYHQNLMLELYSHLVVENIKSIATQVNYPSQVQLIANWAVTDRVESVSRGCLQQMGLHFRSPKIMPKIFSCHPKTILRRISSNLKSISGHQYTILDSISLTARPSSS